MSAVDPAAYTLSHRDRGTCCEHSDRCQSYVKSGNFGEKPVDRSGVSLEGVERVGKADIEM